MIPKPPFANDLTLEQELTSQPVHPIILDYYLNLLAGVPASHARGAAGALFIY